MWKVGIVLAALATTGSCLASLIFLTQILLWTFDLYGQWFMPLIHLGVWLVTLYCSGFLLFRLHKAEKKA